jgi:hypothetical protein
MALSSQHPRISPCYFSPELTPLLASQCPFQPCGSCLPTETGIGHQNATQNRIKPLTPAQHSPTSEARSLEHVGRKPAPGPAPPQLTTGYAHLPLGEISSRRPWRSTLQPGRRWYRRFPAHFKPSRPGAARRKSQGCWPECDCRSFKPRPRRTTSRYCRENHRSCFKPAALRRFSASCCFGPITPPLTEATSA